MKYTILIYGTPIELGARTDQRRQPTYWGAYRAYTEALKAAGIMTGGSGLQPPSVATTLRQRDGKRQVQDGPYAETKEQLGGYYEIDVADLDTALDWAARCPAAATGAVEVRPNLVM
ncbi:MAG: YciI family protein [Candidatus Rokuibacteriota bacterium]